MGVHNENNNERTDYDNEDHEDSKHTGEATPFLRQSFESPSSTASSSQPDIDSLAEKKARKFRARVTVLIALLIVAVDLPSVMFGASMVRILESIYCKDHYEVFDPRKIGKDGKVPEELCKIEEVQSELSSLRGWMTFWSHLPGLFLAVPFGMLADKYGRKWLFVMNILSIQGRSTWQYIVCSFPEVLPLKMIWLESVLAIFGGGSMVATALIFVTLSDVTPTASMASTFFRLGAANMLCFTIGPPIAAALMKKDPWLAFTLGLGLQALAIPISLFLPETLGAKKPGETNKKEPPSSPTSPSSIYEKSRSLGKSGRITAFLKENAGFIFKDWRIIFLAATYPIRMTMNSLDSQILQYVPQRYHWTMANATNLQAVQSGVSMAVLLLLLPGLSTFLLKKRGYSTNRKDILLTRLGFLCYGAGLLVDGLAPTIFFFIIGMMTTTLACGAGSAIRALLTSWVQPNEVARLYTALGIIETIGSMGGGPIIAGLYNVGLGAATKGQGDVLLGLPWIVTGLIMSGVAIATFVLRFETKGSAKDSESGFRERPTNLPDDIEIRDLGTGVGFPQGAATPSIPRTPLRTPFLPRTPRTHTR